MSGADAENEPPTANPDAIRLAVGATGTVDVKANDIDPDGDDLKIRPLRRWRVKAVIESQQLKITMLPSAKEFSVVRYT